MANENEIEKSQVDCTTYIARCPPTERWSNQKQRSSCCDCKNNTNARRRPNKKWANQRLPKAKGSVQIKELAGCRMGMQTECI